MGKNRAGVAGQISAKVGVAGCEARVEELKGFKPHPWVPLVREEVAGGGGSAASGGCWSSEHGGGVNPVGSG